MGAPPRVLWTDGRTSLELFYNGAVYVADGHDAYWASGPVEKGVCELVAKLDAALAERDALREEALKFSQQALAGIDRAAVAEARAERAEAFIRRCLADGGFRHERDAQRARALLAPEAQR